MTKERFDFYVTNKLIEQGKDVAHVEGLVNSLIKSLYIPTLEEGQAHRDPIRCELFGVEQEAINWGDLKVNEVKKFEDGEYLVIIDEADPSCPTFCDYIEKFMKAWGWIVRVQTEW